MCWKIRAIRGATTCENTVESISDAVTELLDAIETHNQLDHAEIFTVTFSATQDLNSIFPAAIARKRPHWDQIPLLDVQQMAVEGGLQQCIRCLIQFNTQTPNHPIQHIYLRGAKDLRPDLSLPETTLANEALSENSRPKSTVPNEAIPNENTPKKILV